MKNSGQTKYEMTDRGPWPDGPNGEETTLSESTNPTVDRPPSLGKKFRRTNYCRRERPRVTKALAASERQPKSSCAARSAKGWTSERRARQAERIRLWQPWREPTGPKTEIGKARVATNALRHGYQGRAWLLSARRIRHAIRLCADTVLLARALMRLPRRRGNDSFSLHDRVQDGPQSDGRWLAGVNRQLRIEGPLVGGPRFAAGDIGGQVRKFVQDAR